MSDELDYRGMTEARLKGVVLRNVETRENGDRLVLTLADGSERVYVADGDCCSTSWVEHLTVPSDLEGATVLRVSEYDYGVEATDEQYAECETHREWLDQLKVYQTVITTDRGDVVIEYRNSSNGYYGGSLVEVSK